MARVFPKFIKMINSQIKILAKPHAKKHEENYTTPHRIVQNSKRENLKGCRRKRTDTLYTEERKENRLLVRNNARKTPQQHL